MSNQELDDSRYLFLCHELIEFTNELKKKLSKKVYKNYDMTLICGPTRAGKSTLFLRIKSDVDADKFHDIINTVENSREMKVLIEEVHIGGQGGSTTIVPNFYDEKNLIDLAGFIDMNPKLKPILAILNFNLFAQLGRCCFISVFDSQNLMDPGTFNLAINTYVEEFTKMFTKTNFDRCLTSVSFVFTKIDKVHGQLRNKVNSIKKYKIDFPNYDEMDGDQKVEESRELIREILQNYEMRQQSPEASSLCKKMYTNLFVADYKNLNPREIEEGLSKLMRESSKIVGSDLKFETVYRTNNLCAKADQIMQEVKGRVELISKTLSEMSDECDVGWLNYKDLKQKMDEEEGRLLRSIDVEKKRQIELAAERERLLVEIKMIPIEIESTTKDLQQAQDQYRRLKESLADSKMLQIQILKSTQWTKWFKPVQRIQGEICRAPGSKENPTVIVMEAKSYTSRALEIDSCLTKADFLALSLRSINLNTEQVKGRIDYLDRIIRVMIESKVELYAVVIFEVHLDETRYVRMFLEFSESQVKKLEQRITDLRESEIEKNNRLLNIKEEISQSISEESRLSKELLNTQNEIKKLRSAERTRLQQMHAKSFGFKMELTDVSSSEMFKKTNQLCQILVESNVDKSRFDEFSEVLRQFNQCGSDIDVLNKRVNSLNSEFE